MSPLQKKNGLSYQYRIYYRNRCNTSSVSVHGAASGNAHPSTGEWSQVAKKRKKSGSDSSKSSETRVTGKGSSHIEGIWIVAC